MSRGFFNGLLNEKWSAVKPGSSEAEALLTRTQWLVARWDRIRRFALKPITSSHPEFEGLLDFVARHNAATERELAEREFEKAFSQLSLAIKYNSPIENLDRLHDCLQRLREFRPDQISYNDFISLLKDYRSVRRKMRIHRLFGMILGWTRRGEKHHANESLLAPTKHHLEQENIEGPLDSDDITVFVSHSSRDREFIDREIIPFLNENGIETWYSVDDIAVAADWEERIQDGLRHCNWFILVMSHYSVESPWVKNEVRWALKHMPGRVVPIMIDDVEPTRFSLILQSVQHVDFRRDFSDSRRRLLQIWRQDGAQ